MSDTKAKTATKPESKFELITNFKLQGKCCTLRDGSLFNRGHKAIPNALINPETGEKTLTLKVADQAELERVYNLAPEYSAFVKPPADYKARWEKE